MAQNLNIYAKYVAAGSSSNQIYQDCLMAGSSSQDATETAYPTNTNPTNTGYTYLSSATVKKTYSTNSYSVLNPTSADLHIRGQRKVVMIPANTSFNAIIDDRVALTIGTSLTDSSVSPKFNTISAQQFGTTYSNGTVWVIGDDSTLRDVNVGNGFAIVGQQQINRGWVKFGSGSNGPLWGHNGNNVTAPTPGDGLYAVTGSLLVSSSKLLYYNGSNPTPGWNDGWAVLK
jgi:hypothetical protein